MLVPLFHPERVRVDAIDLPVSDQGGVETLGRACGLPHLKAFLSDIERTQSDKDERFCRRYQREALARGGLELVSPFTGEPALATHSFAVASKKFFCFAETGKSGKEAAWFVASSRVHLGFPLAALFLPAENRLLTWEPGGKRAVGAPHLELLASAVAQEELALHLPGGRPVITMGNLNFAHHLWNELAALETLVQSGLPRADTAILVQRETLGPLEQIFPELKNTTIYRAGANRPPDGVRRGALFVNIGSSLIRRSMRRRIVGFALHNASPVARGMIAALKRSGGPVFWISVRTGNRTLVNQQETFVQLVRGLFGEHQCCAIVFDGFSLPEDWEGAESGMQNFYWNTVGQVREETEAIVETVKSGVKLAPTQAIASTNGMGLLDTIAIAQSATAYLCHEGTIQHKIGWTANIPGLVHGLRKAFGDLGLWHSEKLEDGIVPRTVPKAFFRNFALEGGDRKSRNYRCIDQEGFTRFVSDYFRHCANERGYKESR